MLRDFISDVSGLCDSSIDFVLLFNILHLEKPAQLLKEAYRILKKGGKVGIIYWNYDPTTPRGPLINLDLSKSDNGLNRSDLFLKNN